MKKFEDMNAETKEFIKNFWTLNSYDQFGISVRTEPNRSDAAFHIALDKLGYEQGDARANFLKSLEA